MATENPDTVLRVPCRVAHTPTDFTADFPHGGTELGIVEAGIIAAPNVRWDFVTAHEYGGETVEIVRGGSSWTIGMNLKQWDGDVLDLLFPLTPNDGIQHPPTASREGVLMSTLAVKLICSSRNSDHPSIYVPLAVPLLEPTAKLRFGIWGRELIFPLVFHALRDASGNALYINTLGNLPSP